ncbi:hypothetical protein BC829DRAFT_439159 [Chytridium lagenaria]|nr:hypothetical protein BC829DRAFT_439159 [Chytridium lagenaria]
MLTPPQLPAHLPPGHPISNVDHILSSIPPPRLPPKFDRNCLVITGKPGAGKTTLAKRIAQAMSVELVSPEFIVESMIKVEAGEGEEVAENEETGEGEGEGDGQNHSEPVEKTLEEEIRAMLKNGKSISTEMMMSLIERAANSEESQYKGFVLDGLPHSGPHPKPLPPKPSTGHGKKQSKEATPRQPDATPLLASDLAMIQDIVDKRRKGFKPILINLEIEQEDLIQRRGDQWLDPVSGSVFPGAQVAYSRRRKAEGYVDGTPDGEALKEEDEEEESWTFDYNLEEVGKEGEHEEEAEEGVEDEEKGDGEDGESDGAVARRTGSARRAAMRLKRKHAGEAKRIRLDNKVSWPIIAKEVLERLIRRPEDTYDEVVKQMEDYKSIEHDLNELSMRLFDHMAIIQIDATQHPDLVVRNVLERLQSMGVPTFLKPSSHVVLKSLTKDSEDGEPPREASMWGRYCPVTYIDEGTSSKPPCPSQIHHKSRQIPVSTSSTPLTHPLRARRAIHGEDVAESIVGENLWIEIVELGSNLGGLEFGNGSGGVVETESHLRADCKKCKAGRTVPPELMVEVLKQVLERDKGWVLDGFPRTIDQASAMIAAGIVPQYVMVLTNDINDEAVRVRLKFHQANSRTGLPWSESTKDSKPASPPQISYATTPLQSGAGTQARATPFQPSSKPPSAGGLQPTPPGTAPQGPNRSRPVSGRPIGRTSITTAPPVEPVEKTPRSKYAMPPIPVSMYPYFDNLFNGFREEFQAILKQLQDNAAFILQIGAEQSVPTVLSLIQSSVDPFLPKAKALNSKQIAELPNVFEFGFTKDYCPFALRQAGLLQKGDANLAVKYESRIYYLSSEEARSAFVTEPHNFVNFRSPMTPPPPRLFFLGPSGSGKTTLINSLASWNVPSLTFKQLVDEFSKVVDTDEREEIEYMMRENAGLLSPLIVQDMITYLFQREPYASKGFLLEGFPRTKVEAEVLMKHNLFVDAFVNLMVEPDMAAKRMMRDFQSSAVKVKARRAEMEEKYGVDSHEAKMAMKEEEEVVQRMARQDDEIMEEFIDIAEKENMRVSEVIGSVDGNWSVPIIELDGSKCIRPVVSSLKKKLFSVFDARKSIFSNAISIEKPEAETLLRLGIKSYSPFGQYCPVSMASSVSVMQRQDFLENTLEYVTLASPKPVVRPRVCILGRPKSGKTTLAIKACAELELIHLSIPSVLESLLSSGEYCNLSKKIRDVLTKGGTLPDKLVNEALLKVTSRGICQAKGWVLDGYPMTLDQAEYLEKRGFIPHLIIQLDILDSSMIKRTMDDYKHDARTGHPDLNVEPAVRDRDETHRAEIHSLQTFYDKRYANWIVLDSSRSKWSLKSTLKDFLEGGTTRRQNYVDLRTKGRAAPVGNIGLSLAYLARQMGKYGDYCPVNLLDRGELVKGPMDTTFTAEYQNLYYRMSDGEALEAFLLAPEKYVTGPDLPDSLPERRPMTVLTFPRQLELQGFCPVTYYEGPQGSFGSMVTGRLDMIVEYEGKLFAMASEEKLDKFMRTPWNFTSLELPRKLPPKLAPIPVGTLPLIGYLEQSVARSLSEALGAVGRVRPKHPSTT